MHLPLQLHKMICRVSLGATALHLHQHVVTHFHFSEKCTWPYCNFEYTSISFSALTSSITNLNLFSGKGLILLCCSYLLPCPCAIGFPGAVHSCLVFTKVDQRRCKACKVRHIVVQEFGCFIHTFLITSIAHLEKERNEQRYVGIA